jgi:hypothetical protein
MFVQRFFTFGWGCLAALDAASRLCFSGFLLPQTLFFWIPASADLMIEKERQVSRFRI